MKQKLTNHLVYVLDSSQSMSHLRSKVVQLIDKQIKQFAVDSKKLDQETRITIYTFCGGGSWPNDLPIKIDNIVFDMDVMRFDTIDGHYICMGNTPLIDACLLGISESLQICQLHSNHAFLINIITDGEENSSKNFPSELAKRLSNLPENFTLAIMVPNSQAAFKMQQLGFEKGNIAVWETTEKGIEEAVTLTTQAVNTYMVNRSTGQRKSSNFFNVNANNLTQTDVRKAAQVLKPQESTLYKVPFSIPPKTWISNYVESLGVKYKLGKAYYQLVKPEKIQPQKEIILRDRKTGVFYFGKYNRQLLNLPDYEVKVVPGNFGDWDIFVQSTSINRHLVPGTELVLLT